MNVIFMDDDEEHRLLGAWWLKFKGHKPIVVADGIDALHALIANDVDAAIIDIKGEHRHDEGIRTARAMHEMNNEGEDHPRQQ